MFHVLPEGIRVTVKATGGTIESHLHDDCPFCGERDCFHSCDISRGIEDKSDALARFSHNGRVDGMEALILACACNGIDIESDEFMAAVRDTLDAISNHE